MSSLRYDIVTPASRLCSGEAHFVVVPGAEGEMGFYEDHESLVSCLTDGIVRIHLEQDGEVVRYVTQGGYVEVTGKKVIILADRACPVSDIDQANIAEQLRECEAQLSNLSEEEANKTNLASDIAWFKTQVKATE